MQHALLGLVSSAVLYKLGSIAWKSSKASAIHNNAIETLNRRRALLLKSDCDLFKVSDEIAAKKDAILKMDVAQLRKGLFEGKFTSVDLISLYAGRVRSIGVSHKLVTEENFVEALQLAKKCDTERAEAKKAGTLDKLPPLHGIPVSIKDLIN